jgi:hypothetical protein
LRFSLISVYSRIRDSDTLYAEFFYCDRAPQIPLEFDSAGVVY